jgi:hypothetical protein
MKMGKRKLEIIVDDTVVGPYSSLNINEYLGRHVGISIVREEPIIEPVTLRFVVEARYDTPPLGGWPNITAYCCDLRNEAASHVFINANAVKVTGEVVKND